MNTILDFKSKSCKEGRHKTCSNKWCGLGFTIICNCLCHEEKMLDKNTSLSNVTSSPSFKSGENVYQ